MESQATTDQIDRLSAGLQPVRRVPRLRTVALGLAALWACVAALGLIGAGLRPGLVDAFLMARAFGAIFAGLGLTAIGGVTAALAMGVPGREGLARAGVALALVGLALSAGLGTLWMLLGPLSGADPGLAVDLSCLGAALRIALVPALGVVLFLGRSAPARPGVAVVAAALGTAAAGAVMTQLSCPVASARHLITAHALAPGVIAVLLALPLLWALRRLRRRSEETC